MAAAADSAAAAAAGTCVNETNSPIIVPTLSIMIHVPLEPSSKSMWTTERAMMAAAFFRDYLPKESEPVVPAQSL